jgi:hypothetical protein
MSTGLDGVIFTGPKGEVSVGDRPTPKNWKQLEPMLVAGLVATLTTRDPVYPSGALITYLSNSFEVKQYWLYSEYQYPCQYAKIIQMAFLEGTLSIFDRELLLTVNPSDALKDLIESVFHRVRGQYILWQAPREKGRWQKVEVADLTLTWVKVHVKVLYPAKDSFPVTELKGIVLWREPEHTQFQLYEGNHRVSAWLANKQPESLPATMFIGYPS